MHTFSRLISFIENILTNAVSILSRQGFDVSRYRFNFPEVWYSPWNEDEEFNAIYNKVKENTIISKRKLFDLYKVGLQINVRDNNSVIEIGTFRGGSAALISCVFPDRKIILWDGWEKNIEENTNFIKKSYADTSDLQKTKDILLQMNTNSSKSSVFVNDVFPNEKLISSFSDRFSLVHFDIYDAEAFTSGINLLWPGIADGGVFVVGGYGAISLDPLTKAVNQFITENDCMFVQSQSGLGLIFKMHSGV